MLRKQKYPFVPNPLFNRNGGKFVATGIRPKGEQYVEHSKFSNRTESRQSGNPDNGSAKRNNGEV